MRAKEFSARELTQSFVDRVAASEKLNAYILQTPERALEAADQSDARLGSDDARPLEGLPIGVKDLFCTNGVRTTACSNILGDFTPTYESKVTENLWADGALMLGKLNNDEFAMGSSNETSAYGACLNPGARMMGNRWCPAGLQVALRRRWPRGSVWRQQLPIRAVYPPACRADRHGGAEANLWAVFALGYCCLCFFAGSGWAHYAYGARQRHHADQHGRT